jgi:hypothetical protein
MNHEEIEEHNVAERHALGRLSPEELPLFEEHLLECAECAARVEASEGLRAGLRILAAEQAGRAQPVERPQRPRSWPGGWSAWKQAAVFVGIATVMAALPSAILSRRLDAVSRERDAARLEKAAAEQRLAEQEAARERERQTPARAAVPPSPAAARVFLLPLTRGAETFPPDATRVHLKAADQWIVLAFEYEDTAAYRSYRVELSGRDGRLVWQQGDLTSASRGAVAVSFPSGMLQAGDYVVNLQGLASNGRMIRLGRYPFRITKDPSEGR